MAAFDLTTLAAVKLWLGESTNSSDKTLEQLITAASRWVLNYLSRGNILQANYTEYYDGFGYGQQRVMLRKWPVLAISSIMVGPTVIQAGVRPTPTNQTSTSGYLLDLWDGIPAGGPQTVDFYACSVPAGRQNLQITYSAGYAVQGEAQAVPAATPFKIVPLAPYGAWAADGGVVYSVSGVALVKVASGPAVGQYSVAADGTYTFAAADAGLAVLISYSYVPADLAHATLELISERFKYRSRIGEISKSLGGQETMTYSQKDMSDAIVMLLQNYKNVVPM